MDWFTIHSLKERWNHLNLFVELGLVHNIFQCISRGVWQRSWKMQAMLSNMTGYTYFVHMKSLSILQLVVVWTCSYIPIYKGHTSFGMNGNLGIKNIKLFHLKLWQNRYALERTCKDIERYCEGQVKEPIMFWNVKCMKIILG
jgi:hypothetical protein